mmetsp:Transcript_76049/g.88428  ORF Transcript_76049/g.88428 Transcript_76049/m.88428 type:complete len:421 (-) Transcript_76049:104-1366(-)
MPTTSSEVAAVGSDHAAPTVSTVSPAQKPGMSVASVLASLDTCDDPDEDPSLPRFVMDFSMFRVAKQLRLLGYDVVCDQRLRCEQLITVATQQHRVLVSGSRFLAPQADRYNRMLQRDKQRRRAGVPKVRKVVGYNSDGESEYESSSSNESDDEPPLKVIQVKATDPHDVTLRHVMQEMKLEWSDDRIFSRCVTCNRLIKPVEKSSVSGLVHPTVFRVYRHFYQCSVCKKVYWGVDNGVIVNYKAMRTIEYLKRYCRGGDASFGVDGSTLRAMYTGCPQEEGNTMSRHESDESMLTGESDVCGMVVERGVPSSSAPTQRGSSSTCFSTVSSLRHGGRRMHRHFMSYPRSVKCTILDFLPPEDLKHFEEAFPMLGELIAIVRSGAPRKFVPEWRMKDRTIRHSSDSSTPASAATPTEGHPV